MEYNSSLVGWGGPLPESRDNTSVEEVLKAVRINTLEQVGLEINKKQRQNFNPCTGSLILGTSVLGSSVLGLRILSPSIEDP